MAKKRYTVSLDKEVVEEGRKTEEAKFFGGKLSPIINSLLKNWIEKNKEESQDA